jgi:phosphatidylserine/phosphatidylglycerophosphate/cardiolipin synthase-like enzyme
MFANILTALRSCTERAQRSLCCLAIVGLACAASGCASLPSNVTRDPSTALQSPGSTPLGQLVQSRRATAGARSDSGFALLGSVEQAYGMRIALIEAATRTLDLQYYAIHADSSTETMLERIRDAASRGVRVRILLDDFNTAGRNAQVLRLGFVPNIELRLFNPLAGSRGSLIGRLLGSLHDIPRIQQRMHNKVFIADNMAGITGGRNIGDAYFGQDSSSNFVDLDVLAVGRVVNDMSVSFDHYWNNELAYPVQSLTTLAELDALIQKAGPPAPSGNENAALTVAPALPPTDTSAAVIPLSTPTTALSTSTIDLRRITLTWAPSTLLVDKPGKIGPDDDEVEAQDTLIDGLLQLMQQARQDLTIISPYFVPGEQMMQVFAALRARGIRLRVLTNSLASNDAPAAHAGYARYRKRLLDLGVEIYELRSAQPGNVGALGSSGSSGGAGSSANSRASLHSKVVIMDSRILVVGSMNLDLRSQLHNTEVALVIRSARLSAEALRMIDTTLVTGAYRLEQAAGKLHWRAPPGAQFADADTEPDSTLRLRLLIHLISPFAPDEML